MVIKRFWAIAVLVMMHEGLLGVPRKLQFFNYTDAPATTIEVQVNYKKKGLCGKSHVRFKIRPQRSKTDTSDVCTPTDIVVKADGKEVLRFDDHRPAAGIDRSNIMISNKGGVYVYKVLDI